MMTLREAIVIAEEVASYVGKGSSEEHKALEMVIEAAKQTADDTIEIVTLTEAGK
jgi:hypothetical protein